MEKCSSSKLEDKSRSSREILEKFARACGLEVNLTRCKAGSKQTVRCSLSYRFCSGQFSCGVSAFNRRSKQFVLFFEGLGIDEDDAAAVILHNLLGMSKISWITEAKDSSMSEKDSSMSEVVIPSSISTPEELGIAIDLGMIKRIDRPFTVSLKAL